jgi:hypothetical protein
MKVTIEGEDVLVVLCLLRESISEYGTNLNHNYRDSFDTDAEYEIAHMSNIATIGALCGVYTKMFTSMEYPEAKQ